MSNRPQSGPHLPHPGSLSHSHSTSNQSSSAYSHSHSQTTPHSVSTNPLDNPRGLTPSQHRTMTAKQEKPRPIKDAEPQYSSLVPATHLTVWSEAQVVPEPPAQLLTPEETRAAPMNMSMVPVISGGNAFRIALGGTKARPMAKMPVIVAVPRIAPNSSGHGSLVILSSA